MAVLLPITWLNAVGVVATGVVIGLSSLLVRTMSAVVFRVKFRLNAYVWDCDAWRSLCSARRLLPSSAALWKYLQISSLVMPLVSSRISAWASRLH